MTRFLLSWLFLILFLAPSRAQEGVLAAQSPLSFRGIARLRTLSSKGKNYEAKAVYPTFRGKTRLIRFVNAQTAPPQRAAFAAWLKQTRAQLREYGGTPAPYQLQSVPSLSFYSPSRLVSLRYDTYQYMGGAHGLALMETRNFGLVNGKPKRLMLADMFAPGTNYRRLVETKIFAKLRKNKDALWVQDGSVKTLDAAQFNRFSIARDGLTWLFNQYEVGPFVNGQFEVKLSLRELGPRFVGIPK